MPAASSRNTMVTLTGSRLCGATADCAHVGATIAFGVQLPAIDAAIVTYAATTAAIIVPDAAPVGSTELVVTVDGRSSNALPFEVTP